MSELLSVYPQGYHKLTDRFAIRVDENGAVIATTVNVRVKTTDGILNTSIPFDTSTCELQLPENSTPTKDFGPQLPHQRLDELNNFRTRLGFAPITLTDINMARTEAGLSQLE